MAGESINPCALPLWPLHSISGVGCSHFQKYLVIMHDALRKIIEVIFEHSIAFTLVFVWQR